MCIYEPSRFSISAGYKQAKLRSESKRYQYYCCS